MSLVVAKLIVGGIGVLCWYYANREGFEAGAVCVVSSQNTVYNKIKYI